MNSRKKYWEVSKVVSTMVLLWCIAIRTTEAKAVSVICGYATIKKQNRIEFKGAEIVEVIGDSSNTSLLSLLLGILYFLLQELVRKVRLLIYQSY